MYMEKVAIEDVNIVNNPLGVHSVRKPVSGALGTTDFAMKSDLDFYDAVTRYDI